MKSFGVFLAIFLGGGIGSLIRFFLSTFFMKLIPNFPIGVLIANLCGAFLMGFFTIFLLQKNLIYIPLKEFLLIGFLGGLTTFSTFIYDIHNLLNHSKWLEFFLYFIGNIGIGFLLFSLGRFLGKI